MGKKSDENKEVTDETRTEMKPKKRVFSFTYNNEEKKYMILKQKGEKLEFTSSDLQSPQSERREKNMVSEGSKNKIWICEE